MSSNKHRYPKICRILTGSYRERGNSYPLYEPCIVLPRICVIEDVIKPVFARHALDPAIQAVFLRELRDEETLTSDDISDLESSEQKRKRLHYFFLQTLEPRKIVKDLRPLKDLEDAIYSAWFYTVLEVRQVPLQFLRDYAAAKHYVIAKEQRQPGEPLHSGKMNVPAWPDKDEGISLETIHGWFDWKQLEADVRTFLGKEAEQEAEQEAEREKQYGNNLRRFEK